MARDSAPNNSLKPTGGSRRVFRPLASLRSLGITDLDAHIKFEISFSPPSWRKRYNLMKGSTHGLCHNLTQLAYFRPANRHPRYKNLYFVSASTHPCTGMPTVMISARLVVKRMVEEMGLRERVPDTDPTGG